MLMATGDYHQTALAVARGVGMIPPQGQVAIIQTESETRSPSSATKQSVLKMPDKSPAHHDASSRIARSVSFAADLCNSQEREYKGLVFQMEGGSSAQHDAMQLLTAAAQVRFACSLTEILALE